MPLPSVLAEPPWREMIEIAPAHDAPLEVEVASLTAGVDDHPRLVWLEGERESFAGAPGKLAGDAADQAYDLLLDKLDKEQTLRVAEVSRLGDEKLGEFAGELRARTCDVPMTKMLLGRLGEPFVAQAIEIVCAEPRAHFAAAMPIESVKLVERAARLVTFDPDEARQSDALEPYESWLLRHATFAIAALRSEARDALGFLAMHGRAAPQLGAPSRVAHERKVSTRVPELPAYFDLAKLPRPTLKEEGSDLTDDAVHALGELLERSPLMHPHAGVAQVRWACDRASLDAFAVALFTAWCEADDGRITWPLEACAHVGSDQAAREVAKHVRAWSRGRGFRDEEYAKLGCNVLAVLAQHGSEIARVLLEEVGRAGGRMRKEAKRLADVVDVTANETATVPTLGLDADGSATFDLGSETYRVAFDETLMPRLTDSSGAIASTFPRLRKGMDAKAYALAKARYGGMVKDAKTIARRELALLERSMCDQSARPLAAFRELFVEHPFLRHLGKRLVWMSSRVTFRIAEDGSFADVRDAALSLIDADITLAHPVLLSDEDRKVWLACLLDYSVVQPFAQLTRETFLASPDDRGVQEIRLARGKAATRGRIFQLVARGWELRYDHIERALSDDASAHITFTNAVGAWSDEYQIDSAVCTQSFHLLPKVAFSELMRDVHYLAGTLNT